MKGGAIADKVGKVWEDYLANYLTGEFDCQTRTSVKIKQGGRILTDIDVLAIRNNVLLVIQVKVYYGKGLNEFEQWEFRGKLIHGAQQAKTACEAIRADHRLLTSIFGGQELAQIDTIQPVVFTNDELWTGWKPEQVPILSIGTLNQLLNGVTVRYVDGKGKQIGRQNFSKNKKISSQELLRFLNYPLDWHLSRHNLKLRHHVEIQEECSLRFPIFSTQVGFKRPMGG